MGPLQGCAYLSVEHWHLAKIHISFACHCPYYTVKEIHHSVLFLRNFLRVSLSLSLFPSLFFLLLLFPPYIYLTKQRKSTMLSLRLPIKEREVITVKLEPPLLMRGFSMLSLLIHFGCVLWINSMHDCFGQMKITPTSFC